MTVRKRTWTNRDGSQGESWVVAYTDQAGKRRLKNFDKKREADTYQVGLGGELRSGVHVPDSQSVTVAEAGRLWLASCGPPSSNGRPRSVPAAARAHIVPLVGAVKLSKLTAPMVRGFEDELGLEGRAMVRKVLASLSAMLADAQERGLVGQNVVQELRVRRRRGKEAHADRRQKGKLQPESTSRRRTRSGLSSALRRPLAADVADRDLYRACELPSFAGYGGRTSI